MNSSRAHSNFFAVQGMTATHTTRLDDVAYLAFMTEENICMGDLQVEMFFISSGWFFSQYCIHAGQQLVIRGRFSPASMR